MSKQALNREVNKIQAELDVLMAKHHAKPYPQWWNERFEYKKKYQSLRKRIYYIRLMSGGTHSQEEWKALVELVKGRCACCGKKKKLTKDHIIPISWGGNNTIKNIQPLCLVCNVKKLADHDTNYLINGVSHESNINATRKLGKRSKGTKKAVKV